MKQDIRSGQLETVTPGELSAQLHSHLGDQFSRLLRQRYEGVKPFKLPPVRLQATTTSLTLTNPTGEVQPGPQAGFFWIVFRVNVNSSSLTDAAKWALYSGSDVSANQQFLIDNNGAAGFNVNSAYYPGNRGLWVWPDEFLWAQVSSATVNNNYNLGGVAVEVPIEMAGKLFS